MLNPAILTSRRRPLPPISGTYRSRHERFSPSRAPEGPRGVAPRQARRRACWAVPSLGEPEEATQTALEDIGYPGEATAAKPGRRCGLLPLGIAGPRKSGEVSFQETLQ